MNADIFVRRICEIYGATMDVRYETQPVEFVSTYTGSRSYAVAGRVNGPDLAINFDHFDQFLRFMYDVDEAIDERAAATVREQVPAVKAAYDEYQMLLKLSK